MNYVIKYRETTKLLGHLGLKGREESVSNHQNPGALSLSLDATSR